MFILLSILQIQPTGQEPVQIKRLSSAIVFDGIPNESACETMDQFPMTMHRPNFGNEPSEQSDVRIGYDDEFLWVGASLYMKDASKIFAATKKRDEMLFDYDAFGVVLDRAGVGRGEDEASDLEAPAVAALTWWRDTLAAAEPIAPPGVTTYQEEEARHLVQFEMEYNRLTRKRD